MPTCDASKDCTTAVAMIDNSGFVYCAVHGMARRAHRPCRKLTPAESKKLSRGETIKRY